MKVFTENWSNLMDTQSDLFEPNFVREFGMKFEQLFDDDNPSYDPMISDLNVVTDEELRSMAGERLVGYDIPMLFEPDSVSRKTIALVFQDPLRRGAHTGIEIATPFALHLKSFRNRRHYGLIWRWIERITNDGVSVLLTDANKIYPIMSRRIPQAKHLRSVCEKVLKKELCRANVEHVFCLGNAARNSLDRMGIENTHNEHLTARGVTRQRKDEIGDKIVAKALS